MNNRYKLSFDVGGTFTDLILQDNETGQLHVAKVPTTPSEPATGTGQGVQKILEMLDIDGAEITHSVNGATTLVTNTLIERKGAVTGLITTRGFSDVLEIGREWRYDIYDLFLKIPEPLVPPDLRKEVNERTTYGGEVLIDLDEDNLQSIITELKMQGITSLAVCLLHSYKNPKHEKRVGTILASEFPDITITLSSELLPEIREYERTSTSVANAYVQPVVSRHFRRVKESLSSKGIPGDLYWMQSTGGVITIETAERFPIKLLESGPAAGALAARFYANLTGIKNLISFDMGGTTAKGCLINEGQPTRASSFEAARVHRFKKGSGLPISLPAIDMIEIGAGGGSIAFVDKMGLLNVGPQSSGAEPGPACYSKGGIEPTATDADLLLGYLDPDFFLGGQMTLDKEAAEQAVSGIARKLNIDLLEAAIGINQVVNENMSTALKIHMAEHGKDPRQYSLIAFGGAGPVHAVEVARNLLVEKVITPPGAGALSALGLLVAPMAFDFIQTYVTELDETDWNSVNEIYCEMAEKGYRIFSSAGINKMDITLSMSADMRYIGQGHEINVALPDGELDKDSVEVIAKNFQQEYTRIFGRSVNDITIECINWRLEMSVEAPPLNLRQEKATNRSPVDAIKGTRQVYFDGGFVEATVYDHYKLVPGTAFSGPAVIEQKESTTIVGARDTVKVDDHLNLLISLGRE